MDWIYLDGKLENHAKSVIYSAVTIITNKITTIIYTDCQHNIVQAK